MKGGIRYGKSHLNISSQYDFMKDREKYRPSEIFIHMVLIFLSDGNDYTYDDLIKIFSIPEQNKYPFINFVQELVYGKTGLEISKKYTNIKIPTR